MLSQNSEVDQRERRVFMMNKVMLITPPYHSGVVESAGRWPNLGFVYIAGELEKAGFEVEIYDAMSLFDDYDTIRKRIRVFAPDVVGVTAITATVNDSLEVMRVARQEFPGVITVLGGVHPTFCYDEILSQHGSIVDYCVLGEGEATMPELLHSIKNGNSISNVMGIAFLDGAELHVTGSRPFIEDLDSLSPAWHLVDWKDYPLYFIDDSTVAIVSSSRGCIHECTFCSQHKFWHGSYRERDAVKFVDEITHLALNYGINVFFISDEYPTRNRARWEKILNLLIERNLGIHILLETCAHDIVRDRDIIHRYREAGVLFIYIGVEATSDKKLDEFKKGSGFEESKTALRLVREAGMIVESSLILGVPNETHETIHQTLELAKEYNSDFMHFLLIAPWPYADMYNDLKPYIEDFNYSRYNLVEPVVRPMAMTRAELMKEVLNCYKEYYMSKVPQWIAMEGNDLKKSCIIKGMNAIMENSFLKDHMNGLGGMPDNIHKLVKSLGM